MSPYALGHMADTIDDDPRGPLRVIVAKGPHPETAHHVLLECGHCPDLVSHFCYTVGERLHCFQCGPRAR